jgi:hypothetical protein
MIVVTQKRRWITLAVVLGLTLAAGHDASRWGAPQPVTAEPTAPVERHVSARSAQEFAAGAIPEVQLQKLAPRVRGAPAADAFAALGRTEEANEASRRTPHRATPTAPRPPPLPYTYLGKLIHAGETVVFLTREDRNYIVRAGETLEERYRIEAVEEKRLVLSFLPLGARQTLAFESADAAPGYAAQGTAGERTELAVSDEASDSSSSGNRADVRDPVALLVAIPDQASIGGEFSVRLGVPAGNDAAAARVALAYNPKLVIPTDSGTATSGRLLVDLRGPGVVGAAAPPPTDVRFRVVATKPATTRLRIENPSATDINGNALLLTARRIHSLAIRPAQQAQ